MLGLKCCGHRKDQQRSKMMIGVVVDAVFKLFIKTIRMPECYRADITLRGALQCTILPQVA